MWIVEISTTHPGCWASETSILFPGVTFNLCLVGYGENHYTVDTIFQRDDTLITRRELQNIIAEISQHRLFAQMYPQTWPPHDVPICRFTFNDKGFTKGLIRPIIRTEGAEFNFHQNMTVLNGVEKIYGIFHTKQAMDEAENKLKDQLGKIPETGEERLSFRILKEDAFDKDIAELIPLFIEEVIPSKDKKQYSGSIRKFTGGSRERETIDDISKLTEELNKKYPPIIKWIFDMTRFIRRMRK